MPSVVHLGAFVVEEGMVRAGIVVDLTDPPAVSMPLTAVWMPSAREVPSSSEAWIIADLLV